MQTNIKPAGEEKVAFQGKHVGLTLSSDYQIVCVYPENDREKLLINSPLGIILQQYPDLITSALN